MRIQFDHLTIFVKFILGIKKMISGTKSNKRFINQIQ